MTDYVAELGFASVLAAPDRCAHCGSRQLSVVADQGRAYFRCQDCESAWHVALGVANRVQPSTSPAHVDRSSSRSAEGI